MKSNNQNIGNYYIKPKGEGKLVEHLGGHPVKHHEPVLRRSILAEDSRVTLQWKNGHARINLS